MESKNIERKTKKKIVKDSEFYKMNLD